MRALLAGVAVFAWAALAGCTPRTLIAPVSPSQEVDKDIPSGGCNVRDYASATELPPGAQNLGWVSVERAEGKSDEEMLVELHQKVCEMGGNALSQPAWVKGPSDDKPKLTANAWVLP